LQQVTYILVTGGAGYVGSGLVPRLLDEGYRLTVLNLYLYGVQVFGEYHNHTGLCEVEGDLRDGKVCTLQSRV